MGGPLLAHYSGDCCPAPALLHTYSTRDVWDVVVRLGKMTDGRREMEFYRGVFWSYAYAHRYACIFAHIYDVEVSEGDMDILRPSYVMLCYQARTISLVHIR